jgi:hypothetical protein
MTLRMERPYLKGLMPSLASKVAWDGPTRSPVLTTTTSDTISMVPLLILVAIPRAWRAGWCEAQTIRQMQVSAALHCESVMGRRTVPPAVLRSDHRQLLQHELGPA